MNDNTYTHGRKEYGGQQISQSLALKVLKYRPRPFPSAQTFQHAEGTVVGLSREGSYNLSLERHADGVEHLIGHLFSGTVLFGTPC